MRPFALAETEGYAWGPFVNDPIPLPSEERLTRPGHVLLVEDHLQVRQLMARALRAAGFTTSEAGCANEARALLADMHVDAVVLDISLPGDVNGVQLGKWLRFRNQTVPLIFITGLTEWEIPEPVPQDPASRFLRKPFGARVIVDYVHNLLAPRYDLGVVAGNI